MSGWNQLKTVLLLGVLTGMLLGAGYFLGGRTGLLFALLLSFLFNFGAYWFSDRIVLAMYGAKEIPEKENPRLHRIVDDVSRSAKIPKPRVYVIRSDAANAFATGRDPGHAAIACTEGIMKILDEDELKGVIAHEISHVRNRDVLIATIAATIAGVINYLAHFSLFFGGGDDEDRSFLSVIALAIITPIIAMIIQLAISRSREYIADETGARLIRNPHGLASALEKLESEASRKPMRMGAEATSSLFIVNPLRGSGLLGLLSTHPPLAERVRRLRALRL
ncbi:M48 family metalloprotease [Candidatus Woesearchaeota archaeon]|nr:M48 family metalloprotease [Candidatus Woesearchaeota archaeon]